MNRKISRIFIAGFSSCVFLFITVKTIQACSWMDEYDTKDISVFAPEIIKQADKNPFFLSSHFYYDLEGYQIPETAPTVTKRNTSEWIRYFNNKIKPEQADWLLYKSTAAELELVKRKFNGEKINIDTINGTAVSQLKTIKNASGILDYFISAKLAEPYFNPDYDSWDPPAYDTISIGRLLPVFKQKFSQEKDIFLKNRWGFQLTRALSISGSYRECIDFFDKQFHPGENAGSMFYRSLGYKARSLYKTQQYARANYLYSYLFDKDPCSKYSAFQSFHPQEESDWKETLSLAKTAREKEVLWAMLGIYADPARAMNEIYSFNPKSEFLPLLLVRSVNMVENSLLVNPKRWGGFFSENYSAINENSEETAGITYYSENFDSTSQKTLLSLVDRFVAEKKTSNPSLWQLSASYLHMLNGDNRGATALLSQVNIPATDSLLSGQFEIVSAILAVRKLTGIDPDAEKMIYQHIKKIQSFSHESALRSENATRYIQSYLNILYDEKNDNLKRELSYPRGKPYYVSIDATQQMISFMSRKNLNGLEQFLVSQYPLTLANLYDIKAVAFMYQYNFAGAVKEYEMSKTDSSTELLGNPFTIHIKDCHDCDHEAKQSTKYTKYSFAKKMIELKTKGEKLADNEEKAQNYFLYANGLYNMTWYGNGRVIHETMLPEDYYSMEDPDTSTKDANYFDCSEALKFYQAAFSLSKNKEFKAKCAWMSAKCEHNEWLNNEAQSGSDFVAGKYFRQMKNEFSDTKYFQELINECGYFCTFINHDSRCIKKRDNN